MTPPILLTTDLVFILAWAFLLITAVLHRARTVPQRLREIEEVFLGPEDAPDDKLKVTPARHYLTLFRPLESADKWTRKDLMWLFREQFYQWHSWGRYLFPLSFVLVISAVELKFCRDWVVVQLDKNADRTHAFPFPRTPGMRGGAAGPSAADSAQAARLAATTDTGTDSARLAAAPRADSDSTLRGGFPRRSHARRAWIWIPAREQVAGVPAAIVFALLGAFCWSLYEILSRRYLRDLTPQELSEIAFRLIAAVPIGYAFSQIALARWDSAIAFSVSALPVRELRRLARQYALSRASAVPGSENSPTAHLGQVIDGISTETAARLEELNITTAWDLAYADPVALMAQTGYSLRLILTWLDQALLVVYFGPNRTVLSKLATPCALDLCEFFTNHCQDAVTKKAKPCADDQAVKDLADKLGIPPSILPERLYSLYVDPHVRFLATSWYSGS